MKRLDSSIRPLMLALMFVSACGSSQQPVAPLAGPPATAKEGEAAPHSRSEAAPASEDRAAGASMEQSPPAPDDRPGLGTRFGEARSSQVQRTEFVRASPSPVTQAVLMYNDEAGVRAQIAYHGGGELGVVQATTPYGGLSVSLLDEYGRSLSGFAAGGRTYFVGHEGERYSIRIYNPTPLRLEVVASVDGLDVVDGKLASLGKRGYILDGGGTLTIDGFRLSLDSVAAFRFGKVKDSYAARTSGDRNVGVIGVAFFQEEGSRWTPEELRRRETANPFPADPGFAQPPPQ